MPRTTYAQEGQEAPEATAVYCGLNKLSLTERVREIAFLTVARANECAYCQGHHVPMGKAAGLTDAQISLLGPQELELEPAAKG